MREQIRQDDDIDLAEYLTVIIKRRITVISVFIVCVLSAVVFSLLTPKVYIIDSTVRIGTIGGSAIATIEEITEKAKSRDSLQSAVRGIDEDMTLGTLKRKLIIESIKGTNFIELKMESAKPKTAVKILDKINGNIILDGNALYEKNISLIRERIQELSLRKESIGRQIKILDRKISNNESVSDYPLIQNTLTNYETIYDGLSAAEYSLKKALLSSENFKVIAPPVSSKHSVKPKKKQIVVISAVLGLMIGIFIAFFTEFWQKRVKKLLGNR